MISTRETDVAPASVREFSPAANALLNFLYSILEAEARLAASAMGLDPGIGCLRTTWRLDSSFRFAALNTPLAQRHSGAFWSSGPPRSWRGSKCRIADYSQGAMKSNRRWVQAAWGKCVVHATHVLTASLPSSFTRGRFLQS
jgi:CRISPR associated protein Cas1